MKKLMVLLAGAGATALFSACGTSQKTTSGGNSNSPYGSVQESNICIELQEQDPVRRKYGMGQNFKESTAGNIAEAQARGAFARQIRSAVISATDELGLSMSKYSDNGQQGTSQSDATSTTADWSNNISMAVINNVVPIKTLRYYDSTKQRFTVFKCLEYQGSIDDMVSKIVKAIEDQISPEDKSKIEAKGDKFRQSILKSLSTPMQ